jgi:CDP-4-dehydro-6-deoxyglucose reductase/ferredoxin-NAD(P)+ reductase (naphthalene dioxygenase ferredoxin-specific)
VSFKIAIKGRSETVVAEMGETILAAALRAGVPYPCGCRSGNCGACKSTLASGEIEMSPYSDYALSKAEKEAGLILACRAVPWSDCEVAWLEPDDLAMHPTRHLDCEVTEVIAATHDIRIVRMAIKAGGPFDFSAGQYASVIFAPDRTGQGRLPPRDFSMANRPGGDTLEFHIRLMPGGAVTPYVTSALKAGERVRVVGPYGNAFFRPRHAGPILALAGGSGLAPIKSMVEEALSRGARQPIHLYFGARAERDVYLEDHFRALAAKHPNLQVTVVLSEPEGPTGRRTGFLSEAIGKDFATAKGGFDGFKAYLAGPPIMVETCTQVLKRRGLARQNCHADAFYTEADKAKLESGA